MLRLGLAASVSAYKAGWAYGRHHVDTQDAQAQPMGQHVPSPYLASRSASPLPVRPSPGCGGGGGQVLLNSSGTGCCARLPGVDRLDPISVKVAARNKLRARQFSKQYALSQKWTLPIRNLPQGLWQTRCVRPNPRPEQSWQLMPFSL